MFDPYSSDAPSIADPANNLINLAPDADNDLAIGVKALRIFNDTAATASLTVVTVAGSTVTLKIPAGSLVVEPLRIKRLISATGLTVQGYTDAA